MLNVAAYICSNMNIFTLSRYSDWTPKISYCSIVSTLNFFSPPSTTSCVIIAPPPKLPTPPLHPITILLLKWRRWWCNNSVNDDNILSRGNSIWGALIAHFGDGEGGVGGCVELMGKWPELQKDRDLFNYTRGESSFHDTHPTVGNNTVIFRKVGG